MKKTTILLTFFCISAIVFGQVYKSDKANNIAPGADIVKIKPHTNVPDFIHFNKSTHINVEKAISITKSYFENDNLSIELKNVQKNYDSEQTHRFYQTYAGIPIEFSAWSIHFDGSKVFSMNGNLMHNISITPTFSISPDQALEIALKHVDAELYMWESAGEENLLKEFTGDNTASYYPNAEKIIVPVNQKFDESTTFRTAYKFNIYSKLPHDRKNIYIDASTGEILFEVSLIHVSDEIGTAETAYSGTRQINTEYTGSEYILNDNTRGDGVRTLDCNMSSDYDVATDFTDADNYWDNFNSEYDEYATDAQFATASTYDYYLNVHGRNSIDNDGHPLWSYIHFNLIEYGMGTNTNAFWNGQWMTYGDGDSENSVTPLTTVDICAHEITHGLTSYTCNLVYQDESGALNEAFSDIFGASVEFYAAPTYSDWTIGEDIGYSFRSLSNPNATNKPDTYQGEFWIWSSDDNGGVHTNMSPLCYWYYLLSEGGSGTNDNGDSYSVNAIGLDKAEKIAFRLQTVYLTPTSQYHDAWFYAMQAAADLYGACSPEVKAVGDGFWAIGVADAPYVDEVHAGFSASYTESCQPPLQVQFTNQSYNGDNFLWDFGDGNTSTEINPSHIYTSFGSFDVQLQVDGSSCGNDTEIIEDFVFIDSSIPCITLMPTSGNTIIENCNGTIYDAGGPEGNYTDNTDASLTIYAPGSSAIVLNILEFDIEEGSGASCDYDFIEFYDGENTLAPQINSSVYCNTTGNPETISSTGEYITIRFYSDQGLNRSGFKIQYDCIGNENPPMPYFIAEKTYTCDGEIQFTDNTINNPQTWTWDFGDSSPTSSEQNPIHTYNTNGTYDVSLTVSNEYGSNILVKENYITVEMPENPVIPEIQACSNMPFEINLDLEGEAYWYANTQSETPEHIGNYWNHPQIASSKTYYLREIYHGEEYNLGATVNTTGGDFFGNAGYIHYLIFDAYKPFLLESVEVNAEYSGNRNIALRTSTSETISVKTVYCPAGVSRVDLNIDVPIGTDMQLVGLGEPDLFRTNEGSYLNYPYTIADIVSIKSSSASQGDTDYYYYFYDWEIITNTCKTQFVDVTLTPEECTSTIVNELLENISITPNPSNGIFKINGLDALTEVSILITDISGKTISQSVLHNDNVINISNFANGVYFVAINTNHGKKTVRLIKN